jgi:ubiquinone/menaquinone biosynthesis C-methylase UbiE
MEQSKIWDHFQNNEHTGNAFMNATPRYRFLAEQLNPHMKVLNIGVGRGGLESILIEHGIEVSSLDPSEESIHRLRQKFDLGDRAKVGFSQSMPFQDQCFDAVVMSEVLEHLTDEIVELSLKEVRRVLKPGGIFIGTVPANEVLDDNLVMCPHCAQTFHRWGHVQSFSLQRLRQTIEHAPLLVKRIETRSFPDWQRRGIKNLAKSSIRYLLGKFASPISSPNIFFIASR